MGVLEGRVALVTGAGSGIGKGILQRFVEEGSRVMVVERMADRVDQLRSEFGEEVAVFHGDVSRLADNKAAVDSDHCGLSANWTSLWATLAYSTSSSL